MSVIKRNRTLGSSLFLAAAVGFPALAQDSSLSLPPAPSDAGQQVLYPVADPPGVAAPGSGSAHYDTQTDCPPRKTGFFARWKARCRAKCWGYPEEFQDASLGASLYSARAIQVANGQASRMVFYQYDFLPDSEQLNPRGRANLARICTWLACNHSPIYVEPTSANPELDELRRQVVWNEFSHCSCFVASDRVLLGRPSVRGLDGVESLLIDRNRYSLTQSRGATASSAGMSTGSSSGGSSSSSSSQYSGR
jgi:hypothetical protein